MPLVTHLVFAGSFLTTLAFLYFGSAYLGAYLRSRGWDINDLILIGLEKKDLGFDSSPPPDMPSFADILHTVQTDRNVQAAAVAGLLTVAFIFAKVFRSSKLFFRELSGVTDTIRVVSREETGVESV